MERLFETPVPAPTVIMPPVEGPPPQNKIHPILIGVLVVLLALGAFGAGAYYMHGHMNATSTSQGSDVVGTWTGTGNNGWTGTVTINADHSFTSNGVDNGSAIDQSGTWSIVTPGSTMLWVEPSNNNQGWIVTYTISGNTMTLHNNAGESNTFTK